jgi:hypothetical protein
MPNFVTASKIPGTSAYSWSVPEYYGRGDRTDSISVYTTTPPVVSATTTFTQSGRPAFIENYNLSSTTPTVLPNAGLYSCSFKTNVAKVQFDFSHTDRVDLFLGNPTFTTESSYTATLVTSSATNKKIGTLTFTNDPGLSGSIIFALTFSYDANEYAYNITAPIKCYSGSVSSSIFYLTQSAGTPVITVTPTKVNITSSAAAEGVVLVETNDEGWDISTTAGSIY